MSPVVDIHPNSRCRRGHFTILPPQSGPSSHPNAHAPPRTWRPRESPEPPCTTPEFVYLVLYHGDGPWNAQARVADLFQRSDPGRFRLVSWHRFGEETAGRLANQLEELSGPEGIARVTDALIECGTGEEFIERVRMV